MAETSRIEGVAGYEAFKPACRVASTTNLTLSGLQTVDTVALSSGDRVLAKDQTTVSQNGIYEVRSSAWQRTKDFDGSRDAVTGTLVRVYGGSTAGKGIWEVTSTGTLVPGTSNIAFSGSLAT